MSTGITCTCDTPSFGNLHLLGCLVKQGVLFSTMFVPRYGSDGTRNTIDLAADPLTFLNPAGAPGDYATLGAYIRDKAENPLFHPLDRFYPTPRVEEATFERTDTVYDTAPSGRKAKLEGVGGVRTIAGKLWAKDAVHGMQRELEKFGCSALDFYYNDIAGAMWGIKDDPSTAVIRGYEMDTESFDQFREYATDATISKLAFSFDLDKDECEQNAYPITAEELGYKATTLVGPASAMSVVTNPTVSTILVRLLTQTGTGKTPGTVIGLLDAAFVITSDVSGLLAHTGTVESPDGSYLVTMTIPLVSTEIITIVTTAAGYDVEDATFTVV